MFFFPTLLYGGRMGGQNHQPCNKVGTSYLLFSTTLSRAVSSARSTLEQANIAIEDILILEIRDGKNGRIEPVLHRIALSNNAIDDAKEAIAALRADMHKHDFEDLPELRETDLMNLGVDLAMQGMVDLQSWKLALLHYGESGERGFAAMLTYFEKTLDDLAMLTNQLYNKVHRVELATREGRLNQVLEENEDGNFKVEFARLYQKWNTFQQVFLASSMLSTELWYRHTKAESLLQRRKGVRAA